MYNQEWSCDWSMLRIYIPKKYTKTVGGILFNFEGGKRIELTYT